MDTEGNGEFARMLQQDRGLRPEAWDDVNPRDRARELDEDFGHLTFAERRRRLDGRRRR